MDEKYIQDLYNQLGGEAKFGSFADFKDLMNNDPQYRTDFHSAFGEQTLGSFADFESLVKKNAIPTPQPQEQGTTAPVSEDTSLASPLQPIKQQKAVSESTSLGMPNFEVKKMEQAQREAAPKFRKSLDTITPDLISGTEENAVPLMNYHFGDMGFKFEESGMTGDWMTVVAPNGAETEISLDNTFSEKDKSQAEKLRLFIQNNLGENGAGVITKFEAQPISKFKDEEDVKKSMKTINDDFNSMVQQKDSIIHKNEIVSNTLKELNAVPDLQRDDVWQQQYNQANADKQSVLDSAKSLEEKRALTAQREAQIQSAAGTYMSMKGEQGTTLGNLYNELLDSVGKALSGSLDLTIDAMGFIDGIVNPPNRENKEKYKNDFIELAKKQGVQVPELKTNAEFEDWKNSIAFGDVRREEIDKQIQDNKLKDIKYGEDGKGALNMARNGLRAIAGDPNTTVEYTDLSKKSFWGGVVGGLIDFAPAMVGPGWVKAATMFAISNDNMKKEFETNPEFKDMAESDKMLYALPFNIANSVLLEFGLNRAMANKSLVSNLVAYSLEKAGAETTAAGLKEIMKGQVNSMIGRGAISMAKGMVSGAELGVALYTTDEAIRKSINEAKGKKMFDTPDKVSDFLIGAGKSAITLAMGAGLMHLPQAIHAANMEIGYKGMDDNTFKMFEAAANNEDIQSSLIASIKNKITSGEMTTAQGKDILNSYQSSVGLFNLMPDGLDTRAKKEAMDLLKEKKNLQTKIDGKDAALVKPQQERINQINEELTKLSEDAIQKQRADESLLRAGEQKLGLQQVGEGNAKLEITPEQEKLVNDEKEYFQEVLDNPDKYDEGDVQDANDYFADPIAFQENRVKFWEDLAKEDPTEQGTLDFVKARLEAHKAAEAKPGVEVTEVAKTTDELKKNYQALLDQMIQKRKELISSGVKESEVDNNPELLAIRAKAIEASKAMTEAAKGTTVTVGAGGATATSTGGPTEVTLGGEGAQTRTATPEPITIKAGGGIGVSEAGATEVTTAKGLETKTSGIDKLPGYEKVMDEIDFLVPKAKESVEKDLKKAKERYRVNKTEANKTKLDKAKAEYEEYKNDVVEARKKAMETLEQSNTYKNADDIQKDALARDLAKRFGERQKTSPKPEELFGNVAETVKVMEELNFLFDDANKSKDFLDEKYKKAKEAFDKNPTSEALKRNLEKAKAEVEEYRTKNIDEAIAKLKETETYKKASAEQQAKMEKYLTDKFLKSQKTSILPTELFKNITDTKNITVSQKTAWADQLKAYIRGIKNQAEATKNMMKEVGERVSELVGKGKITTKQAEQIVKKLTSLKVFNGKAVDKFIDYASKVFKDAEYNSKLTTANDLRKSISKLSGAKEKNPFLRKLGKDFAKIKTSMVENIDAYNEMAAKIKESLRGSKIVGGEEGITPAEMVKISEAREYIDKVMEAQDAALYEEKLAEVQEAMGVDASDLTFEQIVEMLREDKPIDKEKETIIRDAIKKYFDMNSTIIKDIFEKGKDPFTGEDMEISDSDKVLVKKFMGMDLDLLDIKQQVEAIDQLSNFLQNGTTANMETVVRRYQGEENVRQAAKEKLIANPLRQYWSTKIGKFFAEQLSTLPNLFEKMFVGTSKGARIEKLSGITELKNAKTFVEMVVNKMTNDFVKEFYKKETNGESFNSQSNILERGIIADARRNIIGTPKEQQAEFDGNKKNIEESIDALRNGSEKEQKLAELYQDAYDKLLKDSNNAQDVIDKSDNNNVEAVDWWIGKWSDIYDQLAEVSENVYNEILDKDLDYSPRRFTQLSETGDIPELGTDQSLFNGNNADGSVYKKKTGVLEKTKKEKGLPKDSKGNATRYRDLSFDRNNANAMYDALMDIHTAGAVRQVESFFKSDMIKKIIPSSDDRKLLFNKDNNGRVQDFVRNIRNKQIVSTDQAGKILGRLNVISSLGTSAALGGLTQPLKQVIPVAINTLINTNGKLEIGSVFNKAQNDFLNKIGYGISIRGIESQAQISSINKLVDLASVSTGEKAIKLIEKANRVYLDALLVAPDVIVARASWLSYYEKALKKQGVDPKQIDYETHEVNKDAADYAQRMVDRQQNISDSDLQGKLLGSKNVKQQFALRVIMPFASFRLNQTMRAMSDVATLTASKKLTSKEDRAEAARSLAGYSAEMAAFKLISAGTSIAIGNFTNYLMGREETDEDYEKRVDNVVRGQVTGTVTDVLSPIPPLDAYVAKGADKFLDVFQEYVMGREDDEKFKLMTMSKTDLIKSLGGVGIAPGKISDLYDLITLVGTGKFKDDYGRTKFLSESGISALGKMIPISLLSNMGLLPSEANTIIKNSIRFAKKDSGTKEGGKEQAESDKMTKRQDKEEQKIEKNDDEVSALNKMLEDERNPERAKAIQDKIDELREPAYKTKEEKEVRKEELAAKKAEMEELLQEYDTKADMKRYDPELYEKTFGEGSPYYEAHKVDMEIEKEMNKTKREQKDIEMDYVPKEKKKSRYGRTYRSYNSDGTKKRKYRTY